MKIMRKLYHWVLHWAETPYGTPALFLLAFIESSLFPIPPDVLLMALALGIPKRAFWYAFICSVGSVIGGLFGYLIGFQFWKATSSFFFQYVFSEELFMKVQDLYQHYDFWAVFISGFTPIPYKVFTIAAGVFGLNIFSFTVSSICGRSLRFFLVAAFIFFLGPKIKIYVEKYFNLLTILFTILLVGGFIVIKWLVH